MPGILCARGRVEIRVGDCRSLLREMPAESVDCVVTSPPYFGLRDYQVDGQIGLEPTPGEFVAALVEVFREVRRVLKPSGTVWLNLGDSIYSGNGQPKGSDPRSPSRDWMRTTKRALDMPGMGVPKKSLLGVPWRVAHAMQKDGWTVRAEIIWFRETAMSEPSVQDRPYRQHETIFLISKDRRYYFRRSELSEESVWHIPHQRGLRGHSAAFPMELPTRCIRAGCPAGGTVLDPFSGAGTTGLAAARLGRKAILLELNPAYAEIARQRIASEWKEERPASPAAPTASETSLFGPMAQEA